MHSRGRISSICQGFVAICTPTCVPCGKKVLMNVTIRIAYPTISYVLMMETLKMVYLSTPSLSWRQFKSLKSQFYEKLPISSPLIIAILFHNGQ